MKRIFYLPILVLLTSQGLAADHMLTTIMTQSPFDHYGNLKVTGTGISTAEPDEGYVTVGLINHKPTAGEALALNATNTSAVFETLKGLGVTKDNFQTVEFELQQVFKTVREGNESRQVPDGYAVIHQVRVTVRELEKFGQILDAVVANGANRINSVSFGSSEASTKTDEARTAAVADALRKAKLIATLLDVTIVGVESVGESSPYRGSQRMAMEAPGGTEVAGGTLTYSSNVSVVFLIKDRTSQAIPQLPKEREY